MKNKCITHMYMVVSLLRKWFLFTPPPQAFTEKSRRFQLFPGFTRIFQVFPGRNCPVRLQKKYVVCLII